ncbi:hypothetical protein AXG89_33515 (plasmid) [Burkholderia sp. PAMC 26561]|nr:hypothetical protein AXG89_33515 [Burkholderia sp. PAMC 26561]
MLEHQRLDLDVQLLACLFAHAVQRVLATCTDLLLIGKIVLDAPARQLCRQRLASTLAAIGFIKLRQSRIGQRECVIRIIVTEFSRGDLLGFVEYAILEFLAARREALELRQTEQLLELPDALRKLLVVALKLENARDQLIGRKLFEIVLSGRMTGVGIHVLHNSEAAHRMGLRQSVTIAPGVARATLGALLLTLQLTCRYCLEG